MLWERCVREPHPDCVIQHLKDKTLFVMNVFVGRHLAHLFSPIVNHRFWCDIVMLMTCLGKSDWIKCCTSEGTQMTGLCQRLENEGARIRKMHPDCKRMVFAMSSICFGLIDWGFCNSSLASFQFDGLERSSYGSCIRRQHLFGFACILRCPEGLDNCGHCPCRW